MSSLSRCVNIKWAGFDIFDQMIVEAGTYLGQEALTEINVEAGEIVAQKWREIVPVDTGRYRDSIAVTPEPGPDKDQGWAVVSTDIDEPPYPMFLEYGTCKMAPRPSFGPAWNMTQEQVQQMMAKAVERALHAMWIEGPRGYQLYNKVKRMIK